MRIGTIDGRRNARGICHAQKYYVIYLEGQTSSGVVYDLRDRFQKTFAIYAAPGRAQRVTEKYEKSDRLRSPCPSPIYFLRESRTVVFTLLHKYRVHRRRCPMDGAYKFLRQ